MLIPSKRKDLVKETILIHRTDRDCIGITKGQSGVIYYNLIE